MNEEIGEFWHFIKWIDPELQAKMIKENKEEVDNFIGDMLFLILKIALICKVDSEKAIRDVLIEYEDRFPIEKIKNSHGNPLAGGVDIK